MVLVSGVVIVLGEWRSRDLRCVPPDSCSALVTVPWTEHVITAGPDFFFVVAELDSNPHTVEVVAAQFFVPGISLHMLNAQNGSLVFSRVIDDTIGPAEGITITDLNGTGRWGCSMVGRQRVALWIVLCGMKI